MGEGNVRRCKRFHSRSAEYRRIHAYLLLDLQYLDGRRYRQLAARIVIGRGTMTVATTLASLWADDPGAVTAECIKHKPNQRDEQHAPAAIHSTRDTFSEPACQAVVPSFPLQITGPVKIVFRYYPTHSEPEGRSVTYRGSTVLEAYEAWLGKPAAH